MKKDVLEVYSLVFGERLNIRDTQGRDVQGNSTLNLEYGDKGTTLGNETKIQTIATLQILLTSFY